MTRWRLTFKFREGAKDIDVELCGNEQVIRRGLNVAMFDVGPKLGRRMTERRQLPLGWRDDVRKLVKLQRGEEPLGEYGGKFLRVRPEVNAAGMSMSVSVIWDD